MNVYGAVVVHGVEYVDDEILNVIKDHPFTRFIYGHNWEYAGDQGFDESNICVTDDDGKDVAGFSGIVGLNDFVEWQQRGFVPYSPPATHRVAAKSLAQYIAECMIDNAKDNGEDPLSYSTDVEVVELYAKDLLAETSALLPDIIKQLVANNR